MEIKISGTSMPGDEITLIPGWINQIEKCNKGTDLNSWNILRLISALKLAYWAFDDLEQKCRWNEDADSLGWFVERCERAKAKISQLGKTEK